MTYPQKRERLEGQLNKLLDEEKEQKEQQEQLKRCKSSQILGRSMQMQMLMASTATTFNGTMLPVNQKSVEMVLNCQPKNMMAKTDQQFYKRSESENKVNQSSQKDPDKEKSLEEPQTPNDEEILRMEQKYFRNRHKEAQFKREIKEFNVYLNNWSSAKSRVEAEVSRKVQLNANIHRDWKVQRKYSRYGSNENLQHQRLVQSLNKRDKIIGDKEFQHIHTGLSTMIAESKAKSKEVQIESPVPKYQNDSLYASTLSTKLGFENKSLTSLKKNGSNQQKVSYDDKYSIQLFKDHQLLKDKIQMKSSQKTIEYQQFDYPVNTASKQTIPLNEHIARKTKVNRLKFLLKTNLQSEKKEDDSDEFDDNNIQPIIHQFSSNKLSRVPKEEVKPSLSIYARAVAQGEENNIKKEKEKFSNIFTHENIVRMKEVKEIEELKKALASRQISISRAELINSLYNPQPIEINIDQINYQSANQLLERQVDATQPQRKRNIASRSKKR